MSDEHIITNTPETTTTFPGCALLWKTFGANDFDFVSELSPYYKPRKYKNHGRKANESDEYIIANTPEATTSFPGCALLWKKCV